MVSSTICKVSIDSRLFCSINSFALNALCAFVRRVHNEEHF